MSLSTFARVTMAYARAATHYSRSLFGAQSTMYRPTVAIAMMSRHHPNTSDIASNFSSNAAGSRSNAAGDSKARPFNILGIQQVAIGSTERDPLNYLWENIFGLKPSPIHRLEKENVEECIIKLGPSNQNSKFDIEIDLMTPINPDVPPKVRMVIEKMLLTNWFCLFSDDGSSITADSFSISLLLSFDTRSRILHT